jgi:hypothetical protein
MRIIGEEKDHGWVWGEVEKDSQEQVGGAKLLPQESCVQC